MMYFFAAVSPEGSVMVMPITSNNQVGGNRVLTCEARGGPSNLFIWTRARDNMEFENNGTFNFSISNSFVGGLYSCNVSNAAGSESSEVVVNGTFIFIASVKLIFVFILLYLVSPVIDVPPLNTTIANAEDALFSCLASGFPVPQIEWLFNNEALTSNHSIFSVNLTAYEVQSNLTIFMTNVSDTGTYSCLARSTVDNSNVTAPASLTVRGKILIFIHLDFF